METGEIVAGICRTAGTMLLANACLDFGGPSPIFTGDKKRRFGAKISTVF